MTLSRDCAALLRQLKLLKIDLWIESGKLRFQAPSNVMDTALKERISDHKLEIINWLDSVGIHLQNAILPCDENDFFMLPVAKEQAVLWQASHFSDSDHVYNIPHAFMITGHFDSVKFKSAIEALYLNERILRVGFTEKSGELYQFDLGAESLLFTSGVLTDDPAAIAHHVELLAKTDFDLNGTPCVLFDLRKLSDRKHVFTMVLHHIIADAASISLILNRLSQLYLNETIENNAVDFLDYAAMQNDVDEKAIENMLERYSSLPDHTVFPCDKGIHTISSNQGDNYSFSLSRALRYQLSDYAKQKNVSMYAVLLTGYFVLLRKYSRVDQHCVGMSISTRNTQQKNTIIGPLLSTGALLADVGLHDTTDQLLKHIHLALVNAIEDAQTVSFCDFFTALKKKHPEAGALFNTIFLLQPESDAAFSLKDLDVEAITVPTHFAKFDLTFSLRETGEGLLGNIEYKTDLFSSTRIAEIAKHYESILVQLFTEQDKTAKSVGEVTLVASTENSYFSSFTTPLMMDRLYHHVINTPEKIALYDKKMTITYADLWQKASHLANKIAEKATAPYVGIVLERSIDAVIAMLGIFLAKKAFVPIDIENPIERIHAIIEDAGVDCLIVSTSTAYLVQKHIVQLHIENSESERKGITFPDIQSIDNAYMIYTSGSTGKPKGVRINHAQMAHYIAWAVAAYLDPYDVNHAIVHSSIAFDLTITSIFAPLANGGAVFIPTGFGVEVLSDYIIHNQNLGLIKLTPSHLQLIKNALLPVFNNKKGVIVVGGEAFYARDAQALLAASPDVTFINEYGPTETTVGCMQFILNQKNSDQFSPNDPVPIGTAIDRMRVEIVDESDQLCPAYIPGEIYISGAGVSDGYWCREALTAEKFVTRMTDVGEVYTAYRSGDLAYKTDTGDLIYAGRVDEQIKLNGYRIEIGEINHIIGMYAGVDAVHTILVEQDLISYVVLKNKTQVDAAQLQAYAEAYLPFYMRPLQYVFMDSMPLTVNGKLDVRALPTINTIGIEKTDIAANSLEEKLYLIWSDVLENKDIALTDDFFRIGGDSILSIQLTSALRNAGYDCTIRTIFETRTIAALAQYIRSREIHAEIPSHAEQGRLSGSFALLPIQRWFFETQFPFPMHFNHAFLVRVPMLDCDRLEKIIPAWVLHHDVLRMRYSLSSGEKIQTYQNEIRIPALLSVDRSDMTEDELHSVLTHWQSDFNIETGPLWKIGMITGYADRSARLFFALHHLIVDSVSWRILIEDMQSLYEGKTLAAKTSSYRQWVGAVSTYAEKLSDEIQYWKSVNCDHVNTYPHIAGQYHEQIIKLDASITKNLLEKSNAAYGTEINDLLLTALAFALRSWTGREIHHITLEGHGREWISDDIDLSRTVGWFTTLYPVRLTISQDIENSIKAIKEMMRTIPTKGLGFGALKYASAALNDINLPPISFNYLGQFKHSDALWQVSNESAGRALHPENWGKNILDINGYIAGNELQFFIGSLLEPGITNRFIAEFQEWLVNIISHCVTKTTLQQRVYTPSDFPMVHVSQSLLDKLQASHTIQAMYPANSLQQGFIYHAVSQPDDDAYRVQLLYDYYCELNVAHYFDAWHHVVARYPALRTCFNWEEECVQIVVEQGNVAWMVHDISDVHDQEKALSAIQRDDRARAFDLTQPQLLRIHVIKRANAHYTVLKSEHHAISDGWSNAIVFAEVNAHYLALCAHQKPILQEEKAYLAAQSYYVKNKNDAEHYWERRLAAFPTQQDLSALFTNLIDVNAFTKVETQREYLLILSPLTGDALKSAANSVGVTLNVICQFAWHKLLHAYSQEAYTTVGTTVSGRALPIEDIGSSVGLYINTLPLIVDWSKTDVTIESQLQSIHHDMMQMDSHGFAQLGYLRQKGLARFQSVFVFENYPGGQSDQGLQFTFKSAIEKLDVPLALIVYEENNALHFKLKYAVEAISDEQVHRIMMQLQKILSDIPSHLDAAHHTLSFIDPNEYRKIIHDFNATNKMSFLSNDVTLVDLFNTQVKQFPQRIAVSCENHSLSYEILDQKSTALAHWIARNHGGNRLVAVCCDRSIEMIVAIIATLKAGCAYVPIDPAYPAERIQFILKDTGAAILLTETALSHLNTDTDTVLLPHIQPNDLAYIIYTSGTTGKPKGVMIEHRSVVNYIQNVSHALLSEHKNVDFSSSLAFDLSVTTTLGALLLGNTIHIYPGKLDDLDAYSDHLIKNEIHFIKMVPTVYALLSKRLPENTTLKEVILGGEKLNRHSLTYHPNITVLDEYGPTETTVGATLATVFPENDVGIGRGYKNYQLYVLDNTLSPVPLGVIGELFIGGAGLARGYFNRPDITEERFICNPFASDDDKRNGFDRLYKTGDLVKWLPDGQLMYYGRNDFQIKLNGYRIELGEIENVLNAYETIVQSAVLVQKQGDFSYLAAYYVAEESISHEALRAYVSRILPSYMLPTHYAHVQALPLTINGKLDVKALPSFEHISDAHYVAPLNATEIALCDIWQSVLSLEKVGVTDDFFAIGGYSIAAMQIVHKMSRCLGYTVTISDLLQYKTISDILTHGSKQKADCIIPVLDSTERAALSFSQQRLWFIERFEGSHADGSHADGSHAGGSHAAYHVPFYLALESGIDITAFKLAVQSVIKRHDILRTIFVEDKNGIDYQMVCSESLIISEKEISDAAVLLACQQEANTSFDLRREYPIRLSIYQTETCFYAALIFHHIAFDGWSTGIFFTELTAEYHRFVSGMMSTLLPLSIQYKDFAAWQKQYLQSEQLKEDVIFWKTTLTDLTVLDFPTDKPRPNHINYKGDYVYHTLSNDLSIQLKTLAKKMGTTLYTVMLSAFYIVLQGYTHQTDLVVGTVVANREFAALENLIGFFVNSLPLRAQIKPDMSFAECIRDIHAMMLLVQKHQALPFEKMVEIVNAEKDATRHPLFQVLFGMQHFDEKFDNAPFEFLSTDSTYKVAKFDLSLFVDDTGENLKMVFNYATALFEAETVKRLSGHYVHILQQIVNTVEKPICDIRLLTPFEMHTLLHEFNPAPVLQSAETIQAQFEKIVFDNADRIALVYQDQSLTYDALNKRSNQFARHIIRRYELVTGKKFQSDTPVCICLEKGLDLLIGTLAILKAGGAYVPLDPNSPDERVRFILEDTQSALMITQHSFENRMRNIAGNIVTLLCVDDFIDHDESPDNLSVKCDANNLAYVIYTSGTTGKPKGVMIEHHSVVDFAINTRQLSISPNDVMFFLSTPVFDVATFEVWGALLNGAKLIIPVDEKELCSDIHQFKSVLQKEKINTLWLTKTLFDSLYVRDNAVFNSLDILLVGGEALDLYLINQLIAQPNKPKRIVNGYGPTESTVFATLYDCEKSITLNSVPIGKVIDHRSGYVLDSNLHPVPIGVVGELCIGGSGLARGYLNRPDLQDERFIMHSVDASNSIRLYRTGDLVKYLPDGNLVYLGRNDTQVKIRGYRIELAEIETRLMAHSDISQVVVLVKERALSAEDKTSDNINTKYSVAYYVAEKAIDQDELLHHLSHTLPHYMLPNYFMHLDTLPLTLNGKLDKSALPIPENTMDLRSSYVAPRNDIEHEIAAIWQSILGLSDVGVTDDFFRIGGDSILSIQLVSKLRDHGYPVSIKAVFEDRTIERLVRKINTRSLPAAVQAEQGELQGEFALLPIQRWFFEHDLLHRDHWNQSFLIKVPLLECEQFERILQQLVMQHDALRLRFTKKNNDYQQCYFKIADCKPEYFLLDKSDLSDDMLLEKLTHAQSDFNIAQGPLWRMGYITGYEEDSARVYFAFHHLIIDAVSWRIIIEDFKQLYEGKVLAQKTSSYRQWVHSIATYPDKNAMESLYWLESTAALCKNQFFETRAMINQQKYDGVARLDKKSTKHLLQDAHYAYRTEINDLLLTALSYALQQLTYENEFHIALEGHGREAIDDALDLSRTVGWFTTLYPVKLRVHEALSESIKAVKATLRSLPQKGVGYGAFRYHPSSNYLQDMPLPKISFNYLGQFDSQDGHWQVVAEQSGVSMLDHNIGQYVLNINGWMMNGELTFEIESYLTESESTTFFTAFERALYDVVQHCILKQSKNEIEYSADDFAWDEEALSLDLSEVSGS